MNFDPRRKQKSLSISKEQDLDRIEPYKIMQYELKQEIKKRHDAEQERKDKEMAEIRKRKRRMNPSPKDLVEEANEAIARSQDKKRESKQSLG